MTPATAILRINELCDDLAEDETPCDEIALVLTEARTIGAATDPGWRAAILEAIARLESSLEAALTRIGGQLQSAGQRRVAIGGYRALKGHHTGQTLRTQV